MSIQDHPHVPDFLDSFAIVGVLAGRTENLRFMPNVANIPFRPPAMLAKTAASLDVLSGGRFELGLGGGRSWPQIVGMGGPHWEPGQVVSATDEAITILHALWQPIRTIPEIWARIIAEFITAERFDTVNFVPEHETAEQIEEFGTEVIPAALDLFHDRQQAINSPV